MLAVPRLARPLVVAVLVAAAFAAVETTPAHAASRHHVLQAAARYAHAHGYHVGIAVYDTKTGRVNDAGHAHGTFASESVVKVFIATRLLVEGRMHGSTASRAYTMITRSDDAIASSLYGSVGGDSLINWVKQHYHVPDLGSPPRRAGWWGNTHITPDGLVRLYTKLKADPKVSHWLLNAMHHAKKYGSDGFYQFFGIPSATKHAAIKQGWGTDYDDWGASADQNTTGFVNNDRYAVAILARGPVRTYGHAIGSMLTHVARMVLPGGHYPDPNPVITSMSANHGSEFGGTRVTIHGTDFTHVHSVTFGALPGTDVHVVSARTLVVTTPKHQDRPVYARVRTSHGPSRKAAAARFTYLPSPVITSLSVDSGTPAGGRTVTIQGQHFVGSVRVLFGLKPAASVERESASQIVAVSPQHSPGTIHVRVITACCWSPRGTPDQFTFLGPVVSGINPASGPQAGNTTVTVTGTGFTPGSMVTFGGVPATSVTIDPSGDQLTAASPAHAPGAVHVRVSNQVGDSRRGPADRFTYTAT
jgi:hypothetical protein